MLKRYLLPVLVVMAVATQVACAPVAAGVAGAAIGHEAAKQHDKHDGDRD